MQGSLLLRKPAQVDDTKEKKKWKRKFSQQQTLNVKLLLDVQKLVVLPHERDCNRIGNVTNIH